MGEGFVNMGGKGEMIKAPEELQDLRRKLYVKAKAEGSWRGWGASFDALPAGPRLWLAAMESALVV